MSTARELIEDAELLEAAGFHEDAELARRAAEQLRTRPAAGTPAPATEQLSSYVTPAEPAYT